MRDPFISIAYMYTYVTVEYIASACFYFVELKLVVFYGSGVAVGGAAARTHAGPRGGRTWGQVRLSGSGAARLPVERSIGAHLRPFRPCGGLSDPISGLISGVFSGISRAPSHSSGRREGDLGQRSLARCAREAWGERGHHGASERSEV